MKRALLGAATLAALVFTGAALAANTATVSVSHTPMVLAGSQSTTLHVNIPQGDQGIAAINIFVPSGYNANLSQAAGTTIGQVDATAFAHDQGLTLPLNGPVVADDPAKHTADQCSPGNNAAVWNLNLSVAGQTLVVPLYVNPTSGASAGLGAYNLKICLPPWDVPMGAPGRAAFGAQLLDARFTVNGIFTTPASGGLVRWETLFTPYNPNLGTPNLAGTFEARSIVPLPIALGLHGTTSKKTKTTLLAGSLMLGGTPGSGQTVRVFRGSNAKQLVQVATTKTAANGAWKFATKVKKATYFQVKASATEGAVPTGCQSPLPPTVAPAGCVSATLSPWSATSVVVRVKP